MELTLKFVTLKPTCCRKCKNELPAEYNKKTCNTCLANEKQRDTTRRQKRKFEEIEKVVPGDLPANVARKELQITKVSYISSIQERERELNKKTPRYRISNTSQGMSSSNRSDSRLRCLRDA